MKPYSTTRIKSKNFLPNISYTVVKEEDLYDRNFVFDVYVLVAKNLNLLSLERKIFDVKNRKMICMLWDECVDQTFYKHICQKDNFMHLNGKNVLYPHAAEIVWEYLEKNENNFEK